MSFNRCMIKQTVGHPYNGVQLNNKKEQILICIAAWVDLKDIMMSENSQFQKVA